MGAARRTRLAMQTVACIIDVKPKRLLGLLRAQNIRIL